MDFKDKNILITGISGFVGSRMAKRLVEEGANVFGLLRRRADGKVPHNMLRLGLGKEIRLVEGDLESISSIGSAITASEPDIIFHLAAQSFVPRSFEDPNETMLCNCWGTSNLLEAVRIKDADPIVVFAGSSEEYGLVLSSEEQYKKALEKYGTIFPAPEHMPEVPIAETNPLRPMSPYAVSKVYGDFSDEELLVLLWRQDRDLQGIQPRGSGQRQHVRDLRGHQPGYEAEVRRIRLNHHRKRQRLPGLEPCGRYYRRLSDSWQRRASTETCTTRAP